MSINFMVRVNGVIVHRMTFTGTLEGSPKEALLVALFCGTELHLDSSPRKFDDDLLFQGFVPSLPYLLSRRISDLRERLDLYGFTEQRVRDEVLRRLQGWDAAHQRQPHLPGLDSRLADVDEVVDRAVESIGKATSEKGLIEGVNLLSAQDVLLEILNDGPVGVCLYLRLLGMSGQAKNLTAEIHLPFFVGNPVTSPAPFDLIPSSPAGVNVARTPSSPVRIAKEVSQGIARHIAYRMLLSQAARNVRLPIQRITLGVEGRTDERVIRGALDALRPHLTGQIYIRGQGQNSEVEKNAQALTKAAIEIGDGDFVGGIMLAIHDNDGAGVAAHKDLKDKVSKGKHAPWWVEGITLPHLDWATSYPTLVPPDEDPNRPHMADINGHAITIEFFQGRHLLLDPERSDGTHYEPVRWTQVNKARHWSGQLEESVKDRITDAFKTDPSVSLSPENLELPALLDLIHRRLVEMINEGRSRGHMP